MLTERVLDAIEQDARGACDEDVLAPEALRLVQEVRRLRAEVARLTSSPMGAVLEVLAERSRQEAKWGEQNHDPFAYLAILTEEVGELAQAALHTRYGGKAGGVAHMREEAVQAAAVALAIVECLDRGKWTWGGHSIGGTDSLAERSPAPREAQP